MAFMGETEEVGIAELLSVLAHRKHTGRLTIISEGEEVQIYLAGGKVILVSSTNHALRLGRVLLRLGMIEPGRLDAAIREQNLQGGSRPLGQILIDAGSVTGEQLELAAEEQCVEALTRVIVAKHGTFMFTRDALPHTKKGLVALNTDRIVLEASRRADEMVTLCSLLPAESARLTVAPGKLASAQSTLSPNERQVLEALMAGTGTLSDLSQRVSMEEVSLWRIVVSLHERGLILDRADRDASTGERGDNAPLRAVEEIAELSASGLRTPASRVPGLAEVRAGSPASSQTIAAITVVAREVIALFNAGMPLRAFANFTDDHFRRQGPLPESEIAALRQPACPLQPEEQEVFLALRDVRVLRDGRVSTIMLTHVPSAGECKKVLIFVKTGERWQIDAVIQAPSPNASTMTSMLRMPGSTSPLSAQAVSR